MTKCKDCGYYPKCIAEGHECWIAMNEAEYDKDFFKKYPVEVFDSDEFLVMINDFKNLHVVNKAWSYAKNILEESDMLEIVSTTYSPKVSWEAYQIVKSKIAEYDLKGIILYSSSPKVQIDIWPRVKNRLSSHELREIEEETNNTTLKKLVKVALEKQELEYIIDHSGIPKIINYAKKLLKKYT